MISLACQCSKALINDLGNYDVPGTGCTLKLHIGVGAGEVTGIHIGGSSEQSEFFISGQVRRDYIYIITASYILTVVGIRASKFL
jgi:hypothetical protein